MKSGVLPQTRYLSMLPEIMTKPFPVCSSQLFMPVESFPLPFVRRRHSYFFFASFFPNKVSFHCRIASVSRREDGRSQIRLPVRYFPVRSSSRRAKDSIPFPFLFGRARGENSLLAGDLTTLFGLVVSLTEDDDGGVRKSFEVLFKFNGCGIIMEE